MKKYKTLIHNDKFVDFNLLEKGIYSSEIPDLFDLETTIEYLYKEIKESNHIFRCNNNFFTNLRMCKMVEVTVSLDNN